MQAFPGAQGFGSNTVHGSGRHLPTPSTTVYKVSRLGDDTNPGSLRYALTRSGPRIVVFEVSGTIPLNSDIEIVNPYLWVAGQTAPSPGITIRNHGIWVKSHDMVIQHIRVRAGDTGGDQEVKCFRAGWNASGIVYNIVLDHCSASWARDNNMSTWKLANNITVSNCINSECLKNTGRPDDPHSMGLLQGDGGTNFAMIGNVFQSNNARNPMFKGGTTNIVVNNVICNSGNDFCRLTDDFGSGLILASIVSNHFRGGPNTTGSANGIDVDSNCLSGTEVYETDNTWTGAGTFKVYHTGFSPWVGSAPIWWAGLSYVTAAELMASVVAKAGARPADRDSVDTRIIAEIQAGTGSHIDSQSEVGGWPALAENFQAFNIPSNQDEVQPSGYTAIEEYIHEFSALVEGEESTIEFNYFTDFSGDTTGQLPANSTVRWAGGNWSVLASDVLRHTTASAGRFALSFDGPGTDISGTVEIVGRVKPAAAKATDTGPAACRLVVYGSGSNGSESGYFVGLGADLAGGIGIAKYVNGAYTELGSSSGHSFIAAGAWTRIRFRIEAGVLRARVWEDGTAEPGVWHVTVADASLSSGWIGVSNHSEDAEAEYDFIGIAGGGGTASQGNVTFDVSCSDGLDLGDTPLAALGGGVGNTFVNDTFTDSNDTFLENHTGETGATWTKHPSSSGTVEIQTNKAEKL